MPVPLSRASQAPSPCYKCFITPARESILHATERVDFSGLAHVSVSTTKTEDCFCFNRSAAIMTTRAAFTLTFNDPTVTTAISSPIAKTVCGPSLSLQFTFIYQTAFLTFLVNVAMGAGDHGGWRPRGLPHHRLLQR